MTRDDVMRSTLEHKLRVADLMIEVVTQLQKRAVHHDDSKFSEKEFDSFARVTPLLAETTYGSKEYRANLDLIRPAIDAHQSSNRHHPEFHANGFSGMTLVDVLEMLCDWKAASERHNDGEILRSIHINKERFGYGDDVERLLMNTALDAGWIESSQPVEVGRSDGH